MLLREYNHLKKCINKIQSATTGIERTVNKLFNQTYRSFVVCVGDKKYEISHPTTEQEKDDQELVRKELVKELLKICYTNFVDNLSRDTKDISCWDDIVIFTYGHPEEYYQLEKIVEENNEIVTDCNNEKQRALNEESKLVQWQDQKRYKNEDFTKLEEND